MRRALLLISGLAGVLAACGGPPHPTEPTRTPTVPLPPGLHEVSLTLDGGGDFPAIQAALRGRLERIAEVFAEPRRIDPALGGDLAFELEVNAQGSISPKLVGGTLAEAPASFHATQQLFVNVPPGPSRIRYTIRLDPLAKAAITAEERALVAPSDLDLVALGDGAPPAGLADALLPELERCMTHPDTGFVWVVARVVEGKVVIVPSGRETRSPGRDALYCIASKLVRLRPEDLGDTAFLSFTSAHLARDTHPSGLPRGSAATPAEIAQTPPGPPRRDDAPIRVGGTPMSEVDASALVRALEGHGIAARVPGAADDPRQAVVFAEQKPRGVAVVRRATPRGDRPCTVMEGPDAIEVVTAPEECRRFLDALLRPPPAQ